jgi:hypothetical protein
MKLRSTTVRNVPSAGTQAADRALALLGAAAETRNCATAWTRR